MNNGNIMDELPDGHQKAEFLRAKQDMVNRIVRMEEKNREVERNVKRMQEDEIALVNDFYTVISKLDYQEKVKLIRDAVKNMESQKDRSNILEKEEKFDSDEKLGKTIANESVSSKSDMQDCLSNREAELSRKIIELQDENKNLNASIEELDRQHMESIERLLSIKEEIEKKHQCLQNAYEQLYVDYNESQGKVAELESKLSSTETNKNSVRKEEEDEIYERKEKKEEKEEKEEKNIQTENVEEEENRTKCITNGKKHEEIEELEKRIKEILKNSCIESSEPGESIFEAVAKQYVKANWKKDVLERKVTEITRNLKETTEMRDNLQVECDDMQVQIESLLLTIQDLKLNLPSIPEASEERVASLETETESLQEEVKRLRDENEILRKQNDKSLPKLENGEIPAEREENFLKEVDLVNVEEDSNDVNRHQEDSVEDLKRRLVEFSNETNELRTSLEKYKETIEELKLGKENLARELKTTAYSVEELERELKVTVNVKNELERENSDLLKENEELRADLTRWQESNDDSQKEETNLLLEELREKLVQITKERNDLEYDIVNMRKEFDVALDEVDAKQQLITQLSQEKEKLTKENVSLLDQLTATQDESQEKIELLNTEKALLEEEHKELQAELIINKDKLQGLLDIENKYTTIVNELLFAKEKFNEIQSENNELRDQLTKIPMLEKELSDKEAVINELRILQSKYMEVNAELNDLRSKEQELSRVQGDSEEIALLKRTVDDLNDKIRSSEEKSRELAASLLSLESKKNEEMLRVKSFFENEQNKLATTLGENVQKIQMLEDINNKLTIEIAEIKNKYESVIETNKENAAMAKETIESLSNLIREKDNEIETLKINNQANVAKSNDLLAIQNERDELLKLVQIKHNESLQYHGEIQRLTKLLNEQATQLHNLLAEQTKLNTILKNKDSDLVQVQNELQTLKELLDGIKAIDDQGKVCQIAEHSNQAQEIAVLNDKCNAFEAALIQEQSNNKILQNQLVESQNKEANAAKDLERLRSHLMEIESSYTEEAVIAEEKRKELEAKLAQAEEKIKNSSSIYTSANIRSNQLVETLQQQMSLIVQQRDDIQNKLSMAEDKVLSQTAALTNLQIVLEQFQRDKEKDLKKATAKLEMQLQESYKKQEELSNEISCLKVQLAEAQECLQAASRLSEQLDKKMEIIDQLNHEVERLTELVNTADQRINEAKESEEGKVDKNLVKNLLLGYLTSSMADKSSVLRVFATVLDFTEHEKNKAGLNNATVNNSWFSRLSGGDSTPTKDQEASLSAAFIRFLETESKPKPQLPALPISSSSSPRPTHSRQHSTSSTHSTLLLSNVTLPTFPDFVPARNTGSILKEVLKDS